MQKGITQVEHHQLESIKKMLGFDPQLIPDYVGLKGDSSDNIPGIPGIGEKTAKTLIQKFGTLENIIENANQIENKSIREKILKYQDQARLSKMLAVIKRDIALGLEFQKIGYQGPDYEELRNIFRKYEFKKLLDKIPIPESDGKNIKKTNDYFQEINTEEHLISLNQKIKSERSFSFLL